MMIFDNDFIFYILDNELAKMKILTDYSYFSTDISKFLINGIQLAFSRNDYPLQDAFLRKMHELSEVDPDKKVLAIYKSLLPLYKLNFCAKSERKREVNTIQISFHCLEWLEMEFWIDFIKSIMIANYQIFL